MTSGLQEGRQEIYGADGQLRHTYQRGLNIVKQENGRARKVIRR